MGNKKGLDQVLYSRNFMKFVKKCLRQKGWEKRMRNTNFKNVKILDMRNKCLNLNKEEENDKRKEKENKKKEEKLRKEGRKFNKSH